MERAQGGGGLCGQRRVLERRGGTQSTCFSLPTGTWKPPVPWASVSCQGLDPSQRRGWIQRYWGVGGQWAERGGATWPSRFPGVLPQACQPISACLLSLRSSPRLSPKGQSRSSSDSFDSSDSCLGHSYRTDSLVSSPRLSLPLTPLTPNLTEQQLGCIYCDFSPFLSSLPFHPGAPPIPASPTLAGTPSW